jgi:mutator protein MutT
MKKRFVVGVLCKKGKYLAEKRQKYEDYFPGKIIFPGGSIKKGEKVKDALFREMEEELSIRVKDCHFIKKFYYKDGVASSVYIVTEWEGKPIPIEAEKLFWISDEDRLSGEIDKKILREIRKHG